jgi:hypothetical protein
VLATAGLLALSLGGPGLAGGPAGRLEPAAHLRPAAATGGSQWALERLDIAQAWQYGRGEHMVVAILDTGVDARDPDLAGRVLPGADLTGQGVGAASGRVDTSPSRHGTRMAELVAGDPSGGGGVQGLAPRAELLPIVVARAATPVAAAVARGIGLAVQRHASVVLVPFAFSPTLVETDPAGAEAIGAAVEAARARGSIVVAAVGDLGAAGDPPLVPASLPGVLGVTATDRADAVWSAAEHGPQVLLAAPGASVVSDGDVRRASSDGEAPPATGQRSSRTGGAAGYSGTGEASAYVAGALALVRAKFPTLTGVQAANRVLAVADEAGAPGRDEQYGFGILNLVKALTTDLPAGEPDGPLGAVTAPTGHAQVPRGMTASQPITQERDLTASADDNLTALIGASIAGLVLLVAMGAVGAFAVRRRLAERRTPPRDPA